MQQRLGRGNCTNVGMAVLGLLWVAHAVLAAPITVSNIAHQRDVRGFNTSGFAEGDRLTFRADVTPNPSTGDLGTVVTATQGTVVNRPLSYIGTSASSLNQYATSVPYNPTLTGAWTLTVTNPNSPNSPVMVQTPTVGNAGTAEFVRNIRISGAGITPTFNWVPPASSHHNSVEIMIQDLDDPIHTQLGILAPILHRELLGPTATSFTVPMTLNNVGLGRPAQLMAGRDYSISVGLIETRSNGSTVSRTLSFVNFQPLPAGAPSDVFLPSVSGLTGVNHFDIDVQQGQTIFIDPLVAVGYDYMTGSGDPHFASVLLPNIGDGRYDLWLFDANGDPFDTGLDLLAGAVFDFTTGLTSFGIGSSGLAKFRILDIELSAGLDPMDAIAFITGLTFVADGRFTGTMTPITTTALEAVPEPSTLVLVSIGVVGLGLLGHSRRWKGEKSLEADRR